MNKLATIDYIVFFTYFIIVASYGIWIYRRKTGHDGTLEGDSKDYFLAEGSLTWWAIGSSLIASNISAEQFVGMSGSGFKMGLAIATYEWMAAITLIVVATFFIPVYLKNRIFTMPQFLSQRYNSTVAMIMALFWLALYIVVNLTSILYLGAIAISSIAGLNLTFCLYMLAGFAVLITLGGMKVIGFTDVIQVFYEHPKIERHVVRNPLTVPMETHEIGHLCGINKVAQIGGRDGHQRQRGHFTLHN